jgi:hypothetical protein
MIDSSDIWARSQSGGKRAWLIKHRRRREATAILGKYSKTDDGEVPAYIGILEVPEENWGMYGKQVHLEAMQIMS